jgi:hypothetical protein
MSHRNGNVCSMRANTNSSHLELNLLTYPTLLDNATSNDTAVEAITKDSFVIVELLGGQRSTRSMFWTHYQLGSQEFIFRYKCGGTGD